MDYNFKRKRDGIYDEDEDGNDNATAVSAPSLLSNDGPNEPILESIVSIQALQTTILIVSFYFYLLALLPDTRIAIDSI